MYRVDRQTRKIHPIVSVEPNEVSRTSSLADNRPIDFSILITEEDIWTAAG